MGIFNLTPDSFYDGGENLILENLQTTVKSLMKADIIDIAAGPIGHNGDITFVFAQ